METGGQRGRGTNPGARRQSAGTHNLGHPGTPSGRRTIARRGQLGGAQAQASAATRSNPRRRNTRAARGATRDSRGVPSAPPRAPRPAVPPPAPERPAPRAPRRSPRRAAAPRPAPRALLPARPPLPSADAGAASAPMGLARRRALPLPQEGVSPVSTPETSEESQIPPSRPGGEGRAAGGAAGAAGPALGTAGRRRGPGGDSRAETACDTAQVGALLPRGPWLGAGGWSAPAEVREGREGRESGPSPCGQPRPGSRATGSGNGGQGRQAELGCVAEYPGPKRREAGGKALA